MRPLCVSTVIILFLAVLGGCATQRVSGPDQRTPASSSERKNEAPIYETGEASLYDRSFEGERTANGETYSSSRLTAAHRTLPFDTRVRVTNLDNGRRVTVRINDRGPFADGRIIDLSPRAAKRLHLTEDGVAWVQLQILK